MGDPPAQYDRGRDWNVDLIPKFLMANGKNYSAHNVNRNFLCFIFFLLEAKRMCHGPHLPLIIPFPLLLSYISLDI